MTFYNILAIETIDSYLYNINALIILETKVTQAHLNCIPELHDMLKLTVPGQKLTFD